MVSKSCFAEISLDVNAKYFAAVAGLISAALSQVVFVIGSGSSCNQPLLVYRPSSILESAAKTSSMPPSIAGSGVFVTRRQPRVGVEMRAGGN